MSEHLVELQQQVVVVAVGWGELILALEEFVERVPGKDIRTNHIKRLRDIVDVFETKRFEHIEDTRVVIK
jgi:hypothetical protein